MADRPTIVDLDLPSWTPPPPPETTKQRLIRRIKENPFVPMGKLLFSHVTSLFLYLLITFRAFGDGGGVDVRIGVVQTRSCADVAVHDEGSRSCSRSNSTSHFDWCRSQCCEKTENNQT